MRRHILRGLQGASGVSPRAPELVEMRAGETGSAGLTSRSMESSAEGGRLPRAEGSKARAAPSALSLIIPGKQATRADRTEGGRPALGGTNPLLFKRAFYFSSRKASGSRAARVVS